MLTAKKIFRQAGSPANVAAMSKRYMILGQKALARQNFARAADFLGKASVSADALALSGIQGRALPIRLLEVGQRVRVRKGIKPYGGKIGTITARSLDSYRVQLDVMGCDSHPKLYWRNQLKTKS